MTHTSLATVDFTLADCAPMPRPTRVLFAQPDHFRIDYVINAHMEGAIGSVNQTVAQAQWSDLVEAYSTLGLETQVIETHPDLPDMIFCANQSLPFWHPHTGKRGVLMSQMATPERAPEVAHVQRFFEDEVDVVHPLPEGVGPFEGMGDALWHPGRALLWGGYGYRTNREAYEVMSEYFGCPVLLLELTDPDFYHLDTCLSVIDEHTALYFPDAFTPDGLTLLQAFFSNLIEAPEDEARRLFACNAHSPDGKHIIIQSGCTVTNDRLRAHGFTPIQVETGEYLKAGGSVFCLKLMYW
ncbi:MAG: arginine deiminase-related protein [Rhodothermales bacterium]